MDGPILTTQLPTTKISVSANILLHNTTFLLLTTKNFTIFDKINNCSNEKKTVKQITARTSIISVKSLFSSTVMSSTKNKLKNVKSDCSFGPTVEKKCDKPLQTTSASLASQIVMTQTSPKLTIKKRQPNGDDGHENNSYYASNLNKTHLNSLTPTMSKIRLPSSRLNQGQDHVREQLKENSNSSSLVKRWHGFSKTQKSSSNNDHSDYHQISLLRLRNYLALGKAYNNNRNNGTAKLLSHPDEEPIRTNFQIKLKSTDCNAPNADQNLLNVYRIQKSTSSENIKPKIDKQPSILPKTPLSILFTTLLDKKVAFRRTYKNGVLEATTINNNRSRKNELSKNLSNEMSTPTFLIKLPLVLKLMRAFDENIESSTDFIFKTLLEDMHNGQIFFEELFLQYEGVCVQNQNKSSKQNENQDQVQDKAKDEAGKENQIKKTDENVNENEDEGEDTGQDQGRDQNQDQDEDRNQDQDQDQGQRRNQGGDQDLDQNEDPDQDHDQNQEHNQDDDEDEDQNQGQDQSQGQGQDEDDDENEIEVEDDDENEDEDEDQDQDQDKDEDEDEDEDQDQDQDQGEDEDQDQDQDQDRDEDEDQGEDQDDDEDDDDDEDQDEDEDHDHGRGQNQIHFVNYQNNFNINDEDSDQYEDDDSTNPYNLERNLNDESTMSIINDRPLSDDQISGDETFSGIGSYVGAIDGSGDVQRVSSSSVNILERCSMGLFSPLLQLPRVKCEEPQFTAENTRNLSKFSSYVQCRNDQCKIENLREHYHCFDSPCFLKILSKKEEIIRHLKWHKKRNESISHGFLRFSSTDDCSTIFGKHCTHNRKQTHYHCFQPNCEKIYISTSDVQMHSNYHRKDSAIFQEGFQRFRATEECKAYYCLFSGQRTTHFHCRRDNCRFTFKNKADMEKHKSFHVKDKQLAQDGFKKFLKNEPCPYTQCRFSRVCNHIHCVRENCYYVLHSSGQLLSHKRKHERVDGEQAYCRYKMQQKKSLHEEKNRVNELSPASEISFKNLQLRPLSRGLVEPISSNSLVESSRVRADGGDIYLPATKTTEPNTGATGHIDLEATNNSEPSVSPNYMVPASGSTQVQLSQEFFKQMQLRHKEIIMRRDQQTKIPIQVNTDSLSNNIHDDDNVNGNLNDIATNNFADNIKNSEKCLQELFLMIQQFFTDKCTKQSNSLLKNLNNKLAMTSNSEPLNLNSSNHPNKKLSVSAFENLKKNLYPNVNNDFSNDYIECFLSTNEQHLHCLVKGCDGIISCNLTDISAHLRMHEINRTSSDTLLYNSNLMQITSIEGFFNRKRGRPPKNRVVEVYSNIQQSPQAIFTSFKLEKNSATPENLVNSTNASSQMLVPKTHQSIGSYNQYVAYETNSKSVSSTNTRTVSSHIQKPFEEKNATIAAESNVRTKEREFVMFEPNEKCDIYEQCPLYKQLHFHCTYDKDGQLCPCRFVTKYGRAMEIHSQTAHMEQSTQVASPNKLIAVDGDCGVAACGFRMIKMHYHCRKCIKGFLSPLEFQIHTCMMSTTESNLDYSYTTLNNDKLTTQQLLLESPLCDPQTTDEEDQLFSNIKNQSSLNAELFGNNNGDMHSSAGKFQHNKDDRGVSVVRAAGTFFPQNSKNSPNFEIPSSNINERIQMLSVRSPQNNSICQRPFCKLKRKVHGHCEFCNQGFSDLIKLKTHQLKHASTKLYNLMDLSSSKSVKEKVSNSNIDYDDNSNHPQDLSCRLSQPQINNHESFEQSVSNPDLYGAQSAKAMNTVEVNNSALLLNLDQSATAPSLLSPIITANHLSSLHLAHLSNYQLNRYNYHSFYSFLSGAAAAGLVNSAEPKTCNLATPASQVSNSFETQSSATDSNMLEKFCIKSDNSEMHCPNIAKSQQDQYKAKAQLQPQHTQRSKRKGSSSLSAIIDSLPKKLKSSSASSISDIAERLTRTSASGSSVSTMGLKTATNFKMFKDEPIPHGYLKFRFNEDCNFQNCGYRNHQSHFHCVRIDCYYSFCDKTRFVQHTARHERLDKLMGNDFKQYRANMRCGYEECAYNKSIGGINNKSSHFHCLKCNFICSDTNKVVAHRRQHSKMEYIRMAGFRKVSNNEKCSAAMTQTATIDNDSNETPSLSNNECSYYLKQTHYHCLVCDCSVLSRAQLGSHRHRL